MLLSVVRRYRVPLIVINYLIFVIITLYLIVIGYESTIIEMDYSRQYADAKENSATKDELLRIDAEEKEQMKPYNDKFKIVAYIVTPLSFIMLGLYRIGAIEKTGYVFAHSEPVSLPVATLVIARTDGSLL